MLHFHFNDTVKTLVYILDQLMTSLQANLTSEFSEVLTNILAPSRTAETA